MAREHALSWHRVVPIAVVVALGLVALLAVRGPDWYLRLYHPLAYEDVIATESRTAGLDPYVVAALINVESGFRPGVVSSAGAVGLMQVKPSTAREAGVPGQMTATTLARPGTNIRVGTRYLAMLLHRYSNNLELALAAYNAGMTNVDAWVTKAKAARRPFNQAIEFPETRRYVDDIASQAKIYRSLYPGAFAGK